MQVQVGLVVAALYGATAAELNHQLSAHGRRDVLCGPSALAHLGKRARLGWDIAQVIAVALGLLDDLGADG